MARLFYGSVLAGIVLTLLVGGVYPLPQHQRYRSSISVIPDGGREESFVIQWPQDRIRMGTSGNAVLSGTGATAELFRLRDQAGNVVGLASRSTSPWGTGNGATVQGSDWILLLPSRGTLFLTQVNGRDVAPQLREGRETVLSAPDAPGFWAQATQYRITAGPEPGGAGLVAGGTEEFANLRGAYDEAWELEEIAADGSTRGQITLATRIQAIR